MAKEVHVVAGIVEVVELLVVLSGCTVWLRKELMLCLLPVITKECKAIHDRLNQIEDRIRKLERL